jgi:hypothetical protein
MEKVWGGEQWTTEKDLESPLLLYEETQSPLNVKEMGLSKITAKVAACVCLDKQMALMTGALWPIVALFSGEIAHRFPQVKHCGALTAAGTYSPDATQPVLALRFEARPGGQGGAHNYFSPGTRVFGDSLVRASDGQETQGTSHCSVSICWTPQPSFSFPLPNNACLDIPNFPWTVQWDSGS